MSKQLRLDVAQLTDVGRKRPHNEDNMAYVIPKDAQLMGKKGALFIVADGMGGHAAGEVASEIAVDTVSSEYYQDSSDLVSEALPHAIKRANTLIHQRAAENLLRTGMGTTCVSAVLRGNMAYIANVGDSRAYLFRGQQVRQVSQDHSWVEEQVRAGLLTRDQARSHAQRNVITRSLGTQPDVEVDIFTEELQEGDVLILCSDGLSGAISDEEMQAIVKQYVPRESVYHLIERANENGGPDNITAIVISVQEVGWEPPEVRVPVHVGGSEADEDTAILGQVPGTAVGASARQAGNGHATTTAPLRLRSGPLAPPGSMIDAPQALPTPRPTRNRLFYPSLAILLITVIVVVGGASYLWLYARCVDVNGNLTRSGDSIRLAKTQVKSNPTVALQNLSQAQQNLNVVSKATLTDDQRSRYSKLNEQLAPTVKDAITNYNKSFGILPLTCLNVKPGQIDSANTATRAKSLSVVGSGNTSLFYTLGEDERLYQLTDQGQMGQKLPLAGDPRIRLIAGNGQRLLALSYQLEKGTNKFSLSLLVPKTSGGMDEANEVNIDEALLNRAGLEPTLMTAWGSDVYVVLTSVTNNPNTAVILHYVINKDNHLQLQQTQAQISVSTPLVSVVAFPNNLLFLLNSNGNVQSLQFPTAGQGQPPVQVVVQNPIAAPLTSEANSFVVTTPVPVPPGPQTPQSSLTFLSVPNANLLTAGLVDNVPHLYVADASNNHRILDLVILKSDQPSTTPTAQATAPKATETRTVGGGTITPTPTTAGSVVSGQITMQLHQQYTSVELITGVKSLVADPRVASLHLLTQSGSTTAQPSLISIDLTQQNVCPSTP